MSSLGDLRKVGSHKNDESPEPKPQTKSIDAFRDDDWKSLINSILYLFHKKKLLKLELDILHEKVRNVCNSKIGSNIVKYYQDSILKKGMIVLRENIKEKKGGELLERLADVWTQFYTNILPLVLAIFCPINEPGVNLRSITLVGFRDMVLLKTKINDALKPGQSVSNEIKQMFLVLASVRDSNPPNANYMQLEYLLTCVIRPYLGVTKVYSEHDLTETTSTMTNNNNNNTTTNNNNDNNNLSKDKERRLSHSQIIKEKVASKFGRSNIIDNNNGKEIIKR